MKVQDVLTSLPMWKTHLICFYVHLLFLALCKAGGQNSDFCYLGLCMCLHASQEDSGESDLCLFVVKINRF